MFQTDRYINGNVYIKGDKRIFSIISLDRSFTLVNKPNKMATLVKYANESEIYEERISYA